MLQLFLAAIFYNSMGQDKPHRFPFELDCSVNRTFFDKGDNSGKLGFSAGLIREFRPEEDLNFLFGVGYSQTSRFKEYILESNFSHLTDVTIMAQNVSFFVGPRIKTGRNSNLYFELGVFADLVIDSKKTGERLSCYGDNYILVCGTSQIIENTKLYNTFGINIGAGRIIPILRHEILIGLDYRHAVNRPLDDSLNMYNRYMKLKLGFRIK